MIAVGSKVRLAASQISYYLNQGQIYSVEKIVGGSITLKEKPNNVFAANRFEEVVETLVGRKVRCIDNYTVEGFLTVGNIYEIEEVASTKNYRLKDVRSIDGSSDWFMPSRFELVAETSIIAMSQPKPTSTDVEEDNIWQQWVAPLPGHCKCGMLRAQCQYHKS